MASTPNTSFSSLSGNDPLDEYLITQGTGLSDPTCSGVLARRRMLDLVKHLGGAVDLGMPRMLAVGSQSVGKSSLIENISGITLPRDSSTCTRCPIEVYLSSSSSSWQAVISIRRIVDRDGNRLDRPTLTPFGPPIDNPANVEMRIRQAQQALLNPDTEIEAHLTAHGTSRSGTLRFTRNSIIVEIRGGGVDDLAFVDLPGLIVSAGTDGHESDVAEVEELVSEFIKDPHCLILLAISCETEPENQRGRQLVRQFDKTGERTIPVLTKPDRIEPGDERKWLDMLRNRTETFKHGWFCVRQPGLIDLQARITPKEANKNESEFFAKTRPWSTAEPGLRARCGTEALSKALSQKLFEVIAKRLPEVESEVHRSLKEVHTALEALQFKIPKDPVVELHALLGQFHIRIHDTVIKGTSSDPTRMIQTANKAYRQFVEDIGRMTPRFRPWPRSGSSAHDSFPEFPQKLQLREVTEDQLQSHIVYLDEVSTRLGDGVTRELPGNYPYQVKLDMIREYIDGWLAPSKEIVYYMDSSLRIQLSVIVHEIFNKYIPGGLYALVGSIVEECLDQLKDTCLHRICEAFEREQSITATLQVRRFEAYRDVYKEHYAALYEQHIVSDDILSKLGDAAETFIEKKMEELGLGGLANAALQGPKGQDILGIMRMKNDPMEYQNTEALKIMAEVRSYYDLAMQRYTDNVPMILDQSLVLALEGALLRALMAKLPLSGLDATAECEALLRPSEDILAKRQELEDRRTLLEKARRELKSIWTVSR